MRQLLTIGLLIISNAFMVLAWYGHLKFKELPWAKQLGLVSIILISWGIAFFEYCFQVPANRIGYKGEGGPFSLVELRVIQEVVSLGVFMIFTVLIFRTENLRWNHFAALVLLVVAVWLVFKK